MSTIFNKFDNAQSAFINPEDSTKKVVGFPDICVSTFSKNILDKFISMDGVVKIAAIYSANGESPVYKIRYGGKEIAFYMSLVGAPACVAGFEEVIAMGAKKFVLFGCCGVLKDNLVGSRIIVPASAVRDEGTSYHYLPASDEIEADSGSNNVLVSCLEKYNIPYVKGKVWTTDAIYRETVDKIEERKKEGCLAVDMEYSAMLAVARFRNIPFIQFLYGADSLTNDVWEPRDLSSYGLSDSERYMALAFECGLSL